MFVLLRHQHDEDPEATYALDPHITPKGINSIRKYINSLVNEYGVPTIIYCSPLLRCRESAKYMRSHIQATYDVKIKIIIDPRLSRYFTSKDKKNPSIRQKSIDYNTPVTDNWKDFKYRIKQFSKEHKHELRDKNTLVWCVTHYLVIREYSKIMGFTIPKKMPFMWNIGLY